MVRLLFAQMHRGRASVAAEGNEAMEIYDTIVLLLVLGGAFLGWRKGMATQVASIVSIGVSYFVAVNFRSVVAEHIDAAPPWNTFAAMLVLYIGTSLVIWLIFRQIRSTIEAMKLKEFDYQMGALFGAAKGFIIACIATLFAITLLHETQRQTIIHSRSGNLIAHFLHRDQELQLKRAQQYAGEGNYTPTPVPPVSGNPLPGTNNSFPNPNYQPGYQPGYQTQPGQYGGNGGSVPPAYGGNPTYNPNQYGQTAGNPPPYQGGSANPVPTPGYNGTQPTYGGGGTGATSSGYVPPSRNPWPPQPTGTPQPGSNSDWRANTPSTNGRF
jgi:membrane protein required for colicin V production